jgi:hypothetical protein
MQNEFDTNFKKKKKEKKKKKKKAASKLAHNQVFNYDPQFKLVHNSSLVLSSLEAKLVL